MGRRFSFSSPVPESALFETQRIIAILIRTLSGLDGQGGNLNGTNMPGSPDDVDQANSQKTHKPPPGARLPDLSARAPRVDRTDANCRRELGQHQRQIRRLAR